MKKKRIGRPPLKEKNRCTEMIILRITAIEKKALKKMAEQQDEVYVARVVRKLIQQACKAAAAG